MSRLYASIDADASKTQATRTGHKLMNVHVRGWDVGVRIVAQVDPITGLDTFEVYRTGGSNGFPVPDLIAIVNEIGITRPTEEG